VHPVDQLFINFMTFARALGSRSRISPRSSDCHEMAVGYISRGFLVSSHFRHVMNAPLRACGTSRWYDGPFPSRSMAGDLPLDSKIITRTTADAL
jgi:hypothetical protein